jgi:opacity protein-like surface antigen
MDPPLALVLADGGDLARLEPAGPAQKKRGEEQTGEAYGRVGFGVLDPHGDVGHLDTGFYADMTFGRPVTSFFSMEATLGWFDITGSTNHQEVYGAPLTVNARFDLPVGIFEPYLGGGIGGVWADAKASGFGSDDSVAVLLDAFAGVQVDLGGFALGAEFRYMKSDDLLGPGGIGHFQLEGSSFVLTGRLPF